MGTSCWTTSASVTSGSGPAVGASFLQAERPSAKRRIVILGSECFTDASTGGGTTCDYRKWRTYSSLDLGPEGGASCRIPRQVPFHVSQSHCEVFRFGLHTPAFSESGAVPGIGMNPLPVPSSGMLSSRGAATSL